VLGDEQAHEMLVHGEVHAIAGDSQEEGASQRKKYARAVISIEEQRADDALDVNLVFTKADLQDVSGDFISDGGEEGAPRFG